MWMMFWGWGNVHVRGQARIRTLIILTPTGPGRGTLASCNGYPRQPKENVTVLHS